MERMKTKLVQKKLTWIQLFDQFARLSMPAVILKEWFWKKGMICPHCKDNDQKSFPPWLPVPPLQPAPGSAGEQTAKTHSP